MLIPRTSFQIAVVDNINVNGSMGHTWSKLKIIQEIHEYALLKIAIHKQVFSSQLIAMVKAPYFDYV